MEIVTEQMIYLPGLFFFFFSFSMIRNVKVKTRERFKTKEKGSLSEKRQPFFHSIEVKVAVLLCSKYTLVHV